MTQGTEKILFPKDKSPMDSVPIQTHAIKHMETALHTCWELPPAQTAQYVVREMGVLQITDIPPTKQKTPELLQPSIYEFRLPDVDPSELELTELTDRNDLELDTDEDETPDAKLRHSQGKKKKKIVPLKYRRREIQYEELEVSFDVTKNASRIELNENKVQRQSVIQREEILSGVLETSSSQSDTLSSGKSLSLPEYKPIKLLTNVAYESEKSDEQLNHERTTPSNYIKERIQPRDNQEVQNKKRYPNKSAKYNYSDLSRDTRKRIDLSLERKIKRMMNKPIRLLNDGKGNSISEFLSPVTKKFTRSKDSDDDEASNSSSPRRSGGEDNEPESNHGKSFRQYPNYPPTRSLKPDSHMPSQKPLRLIMNQLSSNSSGSKFCSMESVLDVDSDDTSEPIVTQKQTLYEGLPPLNWKLVSLGTTLPKKSDNNEHESAIGEAHTCPIYKCREIITLQSFTSHFDIAHRHRLGAKTIQREHFHRVVEGLPKQFSFDSDHLTAGNSFVALLLYSSVTQRSSSKKSIPIRDYPLVLVASLEQLKDSPFGYFFWFVGYPTIVNLQIKLTVYDPDENVGRSRVIMPRDIAEIQDPQCFTSNTRDHLLLRVPPKHRNFQISLEATTEL
ncbi:uncharacterized protein Dana_GF14140 [Drosophila ananassae]|uniref:Uncharacterized protein n=1 Tax=Drosophila ananassae TaxID=7217 RepID=B3MPD2_DROAN|nr:uncharacterized protein Dana_GF14140 [Drosophila ananassae]